MVKTWILTILQFSFHLFIYGTLENMALKKETWGNQPWRDEKKGWGADKAVDGRYTDRSANGGQCVISENSARTATWRVDLGGVVSISHIDIYYRTDNKPRFYINRMAGFFLYVSNTSSLSTSKTQAHLCFHDEGIKPLSDEQRIVCSVRGRYVFYHNERLYYNTKPGYSKYAFYELCELEVYGCSSSPSGEQNCPSQCPSSCLENTCDIKTGHCCDQGFYGHDCTGQCPKNCLDQRCHIDQGHCVDCSSGFYDPMCNTSCPPNCQNKRCNISGHCFSCEAGYQGPNCRQVCNTQTYGAMCSQTCGNCSNGETCHHVNGTCLHGCNEGAQGGECKTECAAGFYGKGCLSNCSENCNVTRSCNRFTGKCEGGCKPGWKKPTCDKTCDNGRYGLQCTDVCGHCNANAQCHHITGSCTTGCSPGYNGTLCKDECIETFYGVNCTERCSADCVNNTCKHDTGVCYSYKQGLEQLNLDELPTIGIITASAVVLVIIGVSILVYKRSRSGSETERPQRDEQPGANTNPKSSQKVSATFTKALQKAEIWNGMNYGEIPSTSTGTDGPLKDDEIDVDEKIHEENPYGDLYINEANIPDIALKNLASIIEEKSKNEDDGFKKEYATLLYGERYPCEAGTRPDNVPKNRFKTTFPYDHSRVVLLDTREDYINANYIDGLKEERRYIAAQGPKQNTVSDFWLMAWQENVTQVVMLTNLKEGRKDKCVQYWPDFAKIMTYGCFTMRTEEEKNYAYYVIRKLKISHRQLNESRIITQYHYTAWPDHGTPDSVCLLLFHNHVTRTRNPVRSGPIIVHCSAGIGRTGTYIAIDALSESLQKNKKINIAEYVKKMRENRMNMVQTYEQYKTIFLTLQEMVKANVNSENPSDFIKKLDAGNRDKPVNSSILRKEFQKLLSVLPQYTKSDYKIASQNGDPSSTILPLDEYILFLTSNVPNRGSYVNAITLPSYTNNTGFILTHYPTTENTVDFLRLVTDHESEVVIFMEPLSTVESANHWLPQVDNPMTVTPFKTRLLQDESKDVKCCKIQIIREKSNDSWTITLAEPANAFDVDYHSKWISQILRFVTFIRNTETDAPITVVSRDGAALCGVFCAVFNTIQQLTMDNEVDVFSIVRQLQIRRPELCSSLQEYSMIHDALKSFIQSRDSRLGENIYANQ